MRDLIDLIEAAASKAPVGGTFDVFHGTPAAFQRFDPRHLGDTHGYAPINRAGFNFTDVEAVARTFGAIILVCKVTIERPLVINARGGTYSTFKETLNDKLDALRPGKHDGIIIKNYKDAGKFVEKGQSYLLSNHFIPLSVSQIKIVKRINPKV